MENAPEGERSNLKVIEEGELVDKNFKNEDSANIKR